MKRGQERGSIEDFKLTETSPLGRVFVEQNRDAFTERGEVALPIKGALNFDNFFCLDTKIKLMFFWGQMVFKIILLLED